MYKHFGYTIVINAKDLLSLQCNRGGNGFFSIDRMKSNHIIYKNYGKEIEF